jgi:D-amino peptidase
MIARMPLPLRSIVAGAACSILAAGALAAQTPLKVYISADMEGVAGVVTADQLGPGGFEYAKAREWMTGEVLAAIEGARAAGATEILVADSHGNGENLLLDLLPEDVRVVRSWPRPLMMMQDIDSTFDAAILIGYHAGTGNPEGVRAHTMSSANLAGLAVNGRELPEAGFSAAIAGHFGVPVAFISGDDHAVAEARALIGATVTGVEVKRAISFHSANTLTPQAARALIRDGVRTALSRPSATPPFVLAPPLKLDITFKNYRPAAMLAWLPGVERIDSHTVRYTAATVPEISRFIEFATTYQVDLTP